MNDTKRYQELAKHFTEYSGIDAIDPSTLEELSLESLIRIQEQVLAAIKRKTGVYK